MGSETEVLLVTERAFINGDWSRAFPFFFRSENGFTQLITADFDLDTVKLLMSLFVESLGVFLPSTRCLSFSHHFLQDADKSGELDFVEVSVLVSGNRLIIFRCYFSTSSPLFGDMSRCVPGLVSRKRGSFMSQFF